MTNAFGRNLTASQLQREMEQFLAAFPNLDTRGTYRRGLRAFNRWCQADPSFRFRVEDIERYKTFLTTIRRLSPLSVSTYLTAVRRWCAHLVERGLLQENPAEHVAGNRRPQRHTRAYLSDAEIARLLETLSEENEAAARNNAIIRLMMDCGLTSAEIAYLDVDDYGGTPLQRFMKMRRTKTPRGEDVPVPFDTARVLDRYLAWRRRHEGERLATPLFVSRTPRRRGCRLSRRAIHAIVTMHFMRAGIERSNVTPLSLRHTAARRMANAGATPEEIRRRLRLGSLKTTYVYLQ